MTIVPYSDDFDRAAVLNVASGDWVGRSTSNPTCVTRDGGRCVAAATTSTGYAIHTASHLGIQRSQVTLEVIGSATNKVALMVGVEDVSYAAGTNTLNIYAADAPQFYRLRAIATRYELGKKNVGGAGVTLLDTYDTAPAVGDVIELEYDPATFTVKGYIDGVERMSYDDSADPLPADQTRIGFHVENSTEISSWAGEYEVDDGPGPPDSGGWRFFEWVDPDEIELTPTEYDGVTENDFAMAATTIYPEDTSGLPLVQPLWSDAIRDGYGVNCHYKFSSGTDNVHYYTTNLTALITELGCGWVRDRLVTKPSANPGAGTPWAKQIAGITALQAVGIGFHLTLSVGNSEGGWDATTQADVTYYWGEIAARGWSRITVGGPNEPDATPQITNWLSKLVTHQKMIWDTRATAGMTQHAIAAPSMKDGNIVVAESYRDAAASNIYQYMDYGDIHRYPLGANRAPADVGHPDYDPNFEAEALDRTPEYLVELRKSWASAAYHTNDMFWTEGGYNTDLSINVGGEHIPDDVQAYYSERTLLSALRFGFKRFFQYELMDDPKYTTGGALIPSSQLVEVRRGIYFVDVNNTGSTSPTNWAPKPAFTRMKALMAQVRDIGGGYDPHTNPYVPPQTRLEVTCADSRFRWLLTAKRDGTKRLYYWLDKALWDVSADERITVDPVDATYETPTEGVVDITATAIVQSVVLE